MILAGLQALASHGGAVEVRALEVRDPNPNFAATWAGYYSPDHLPEAAQAIATQLDGRAVGIYITLNPVNPALLARAANRLAKKPRHTTGDADILRRHWLPIDCDPIRPAGISATDAELATALACRDDLIKFLTDLDFPEPVRGMSGNGGHALYRLDEPNDGETTRLIQQALLALKERFPLVDPAVFNPSRIWKIPGTLTCKGDATADRPHRRATLESVPLEEFVVPRAALTQLAQMTRSVSSQGWTRVEDPDRNEGDDLDVLEAFKARGWYHGPGVKAGQHFVKCPFDPEEDTRRRQTALYEPTEVGGPWGFHCFHESCASRSIRDIYQLLRTAGNADPLASDAAHGSEPTIALHTRRLSAVTAKPIDWVWPTRYARGFLTGIFGDGGTCKSTFDVMVMARLTTGAPMPFETTMRPPGTCVVLSLEDDAAYVLKPRFIAAGGDPDRLIIIDSVYNRQTGARVRQVELERDLELLRATLIKTEAVHFTISPVSAYLGSTRNSWKDSDVRAIIDPLHAMAADLNLTGTLVSHPNKSVTQRAAYRMSGSQAFRNACRVVLVVAIDPEDAEHERHIIVGEKWNISAPARPLAFYKVIETHAIDGQGIETVRLDFPLEQDLDRLKYTADFLLSPPPTAQEAREIDVAKEFLAQALGPTGQRVPVKEVNAGAKDLGISIRTLRRARAALGVRPGKAPDGSWAIWISPKDHPANRKRRQR